MGEVYRGRDTRLRRDVAIKVMSERHAPSAQMRQRFEREAHAISRLSHPHICTLFDVGVQDGVDYLVMEFLEGETLADVLRRGPLPPAQVLRFGADIAGALSEAHRQGIVHRDLKPGNVMVTRTGVKVLDFGLATIAADPTPDTSPNDATAQMPLTEAGTTVGTLQYMAPEQIANGRADARSDIFALGAILYEMSTGRPAFAEATRAATIAAILERDPPPVSSLQPLAPPAFDEVVRTCIAKSPDERFQSAHDLAFALQQIGSQPMPASPTLPRRRMWMAALALAAIVLAVSASLLLWRRSTAAPASTLRTLAVLPFQSLGLGPAQDYLRLAVADEVTTILSTNDALAVRPFSISRRLDADVDPREAARDLQVAAIVTGSLRTQGDRLFVTLEAIDARENRLLWREAFDSPAGDLLTLRQMMSSRIQDGLMPRLAPSAAGAVPSPSSGPRNQQAYALFLRATAMSRDPGPNEDALRLLEEAVRLDDGYAPTWAAMATRAYFSYSYNAGGEAAYRRATEAAQRALAIDPQYVEPAARLVTMRTENGETVQAWRDATELVRRHPEVAQAHLALSYVLRYGGALEESGRQCEQAWRLDPHHALRSCALTFIMLGNLTRAEDFAGLDAGSAWSRAVTSDIRLRQGRVEEAKRLVAGNFGGAKELIAVSDDELDAAMDGTLSHLRDRRDGEPMYSMAAIAAYRGRHQRAIELLTEGTRRGFCGYPAIDRDPLLAPLRTHPSWPAYRAAAVQCHEAFMRGIR